MFASPYCQWDRSWCPIRCPCLLLVLLACASGSPEHKVSSTALHCKGEGTEKHLWHSFGLPNLTQLLYRKAESCCSCSGMFWLGIWMAQLCSWYKEIELLHVVSGRAHLGCWNIWQKHLLLESFVLYHLVSKCFTKELQSNELLM